MLYSSSADFTKKREETDPIGDKKSNVEVGSMPSDS